MKGTGIALLLLLALPCVFEASNAMPNLQANADDLEKLDRGYKGAVDAAVEGIVKGFEDSNVVGKQ